MDKNDIQFLADLIDCLELKTYEVVEWEDIHAPLYKALTATRSRLVYALAGCDALVGAEHCDECGDYVDTIVRVEHSPGAMLVGEKRGYSPEHFTIGDVYLRLPGSATYGDQALVELARDRAAA